MRQKLKLILGVVLFLLFIAGAALTYNLLSHKPVAPNGDIEPEDSLGVIELKEEDAKQRAPDFTMEDQEGNTVKLSAFVANEKPVVLNFWASWCPPCISEMPTFNTVFQELKDEVQFIMVDLVDGQRETIEIGSKYVEEQGFSFPVFFDTKQEGAYMYGIRSIPSTLFIDKEGYVVTAVQGAIDEATLRQGIEMMR